MKTPTLSRLLAVDDELDVTFMSKVILGQCGFSKDIFNDPFRNKMPQMNGSELYQEINNTPSHVKGVKVLHVHTVLSKVAVGNTFNLRVTTIVNNSTATITFDNGTCISPDYASNY